MASSHASEQGTCLECRGGSTMALEQFMLRVYVSAHCLACRTAIQRAERLEALRPEVPVTVVDVEAPDAVVPRKVIGTPIYMWNDRVVFMGNPSEQELLDRVTVLHYDSERERSG